MQHQNVDETVDEFAKMPTGVMVGWFMFSVLAVWLAFPPIGWWWIAWVAPVGWLRVIRAPALRSQHPYRWFWLLAFGFWLLMIQWVRLPHFAAGIGWIVLSGYLTVYVVAFIAISRQLVHVARWPLWIVVPIVWTSLEFARAHLFTGFALVLLGHSQFRQLPVIQISEWTGAYGVSFLVMLGAAAGEHLWQALQYETGNRASTRFGPVLISFAIIAAAIIGGTSSTTWQTPITNASSSESEMAIERTDSDGSQGEKTDRRIRVALIQGAYDTTFPHDLASAERQVQDMRQTYERYAQMSREAVQSYGDIDLVVWPESIFAFGQNYLYTFEPGATIRDDSVGDSYSLEEIADWNRRHTADQIRQIGAACLVGTTHLHFTADGEQQQFNSAVLYAADGSIVGHYSKMHPVMFGEYVPLGEMFPWLYQLTPMSQGLKAGKAPVSMSTGDGSLRLCPSICFENTVPHLIRRQVKKLHDQNKPVDALVTLTNDGWFWGSSLLDVHLACGIFRAVENRRPAIICANTGFSALIDSRGRIVQQGARRAESLLVGEVGIECETLSFYTRWGDWFPAMCVICTGLGLLSSFCFGRSDLKSRMNAEATEAGTQRVAAEN